jgi:hypothetical protein
MIDRSNERPIERSTRVETPKAGREPVSESDIAESSASNEHRSGEPQPVGVTLAATIKRIEARYPELKKTS